MFKRCQLFQGLLPSQADVVNPQLNQQPIFLVIRVLSFSCTRHINHPLALKTTSMARLHDAKPSHSWEPLVWSPGLRSTLQRSHDTRKNQPPTATAEPCRAMRSHADRGLKPYSRSTPGGFVMDGRHFSTLCQCFASS